MRIKSAQNYFPGEEIGGIILQDGTTEFFKNLSKDKQNHYIANPYETEKFEKDIYCTFHTHVNQDHNLSEFDRLISEKQKVPMLVYSNLTNNFEFYEPKGIKIPLLNRPFILGIFDCTELVKDYYEEVLNIRFPKHDFFHWRLLTYEEMVKSPYNKEEYINVFVDYYRGLGFSKVTKNIQKGDIVFFPERDVKPACHVSVYDGNGVFYDQPSKSPSRKRTLKNFVSKGKVFQKSIAVMRKTS